MQWGLFRLSLQQQLVLNPVLLKLYQPSAKTLYLFLVDDIVCLEVGQALLIRLDLRSAHMI